MDINIVVAGEAGQGLKTVDQIIGKSLHRLGFSVFSSKNYMSRIRGGHNFMQIRFGDGKITGPVEDIDILIALNEDGVDIHQDKVKEDGVILFDGDKDIDYLNVPAKEMAKEVNPKAVNTVFLGYAWKLLGLPLDALKEVIKEKFGEGDVYNDNVELLDAAYDKVESSFDCELPANDAKGLYLNGNQAVGFGAATAGVQFYSAYPMTPSTGILNYLASRQDKLGIAVEQAEDEIAAINMAIGASFGGARAMTGTSGGGFSLMAEGLGLAGIMETPLVIAEVQRPGPATGLPTRTEQADLSFVINASQGEFPLKVIAPRDQEDAFYQAFRAFNLADKYQLPVILLTDAYLADAAATVPEFKLDELEIDRNLVDENEWPENKEYKRYELTEDGISPRSYPGQLEGEVVLLDSDEHDENGFIIEDAETRVKMVDKRMAKFEKLKREDTVEPLYIGPDKPDYMLVSFGSTYGALKEAMDQLNGNGHSIGMLSFSDIWPLPTAELEKQRSYDTKLVVVEGNSTGQLASLIQAETGLTVDHRILKYDGRPFTVDGLVRELEEEVIS